jgi:hypothetical protein
MPKIAEVKLSSCGLEVADLGKNCGCGFAELRLRSNISLKVAELRLRNCFIQVAELRLRTQKKVVRAHLWMQFMKKLDNEALHCVCNCSIENVENL